MSKSDILEKILNTKKSEISQAQSRISLTQLKHRCQGLAPCRDFAGSINSRIKNKKNAVIAEVKKASPSLGVIREDFNIEQIVLSYKKAGASCLSILTDEQYFQGSLNYLTRAKDKVDLPILRKDFIIDEYQLYESRLGGADCILLIAAALNSDQLTNLTQCTHSLGMDVLVEVHNAEELKQVIHLDKILLGINNRNLKTFETRLSTTLELLPLVPKDTPVICESGIRSKDDIKLMNDNQVYGFLIGEAFMRSDSPGDKLNELFSI